MSPRKSEESIRTYNIMESTKKQGEKGIHALGKKVLVIAILTMICYLFAKSLLDFRQKQQFNESYLKEYQKQLELNKKLKSDIARSTDYYTVEKNVREKLNPLKPDEIELILPKISTIPTPTPTINLPVYEQWRRVFF